MWTEGGAVEEELWHFAQTTLEQPKGCETTEGDNKGASWPYETKTTNSFPSSCKPRVLWVSPSPSYPVLQEYQMHAIITEP